MSTAQQQTEQQTPITLAEVSTLSVDDAAGWIRGDAGRAAVERAAASLGWDLDAALSLLKPEPLEDDRDQLLRSTSLGDAVASVDLLGVSPYVEAFTRVILHRETTTPLVIAVMGEWGKGKSSFMRFLREDLEAHGLPTRDPELRGASADGPLISRVVTVWFDAWKYNSEEKVFAALLQSMAQEIERRFTPYGWIKYAVGVVWRKLRASWKARYRLIGWLIVFAALLWLALGMMQPRDASAPSTENPLTIDGLLKLLGQSGAIGLIAVALYWTWRAVRAAKLPLGLNLKALFTTSNPAERLGYLAVFTDEFERRIDQLARTSRYSLRASPEVSLPSFALTRLQAKDFWEDVKTLARAAWAARPFRRKGARDDERRNARQTENRIVIFIDDLDRCQPCAVADILEAIKVSLEKQGIVFVIGMDDAFVKSSIYLRYKDHIDTQQKLYPPREAQLSDQWPTRYLEKIVQLGFHLPDASPDEIREMIKRSMGLADDAGEVRGGQAEPTPATRAVAAGKATPAQVKEAKAEQVKQRIINREAVLSELDDPDLEGMLARAAWEVAPDLGGNPRRAKSFVNRARLGVYLLKLRIPGLTADDLATAVERFVAWERERVGGRPESAPPSLDHEFEGALEEVREGLFRATAVARPPESRTKADSPSAMRSDPTPAASSAG